VLRSAGQIATNCQAISMGDKEQWLLHATRMQHDAPRTRSPGRGFRGIAPRTSLDPPQLARLVARGDPCSRSELMVLGHMASHHPRLAVGLALDRVERGLGLGDEHEVARTSTLRSASVICTSAIAWASTLCARLRAAPVRRPTLAVRLGVGFKIHGHFFSVGGMRRWICAARALRSSSHAL
jgi:hypothetical protein